MKVVNRRSLWKGRFLETLMISYQDREGVIRHWEAVSRVNVRGIVIMIPLTARQELILIRQYRPPLDCYVMELPAGLVEQDEDFLEAARRELIEETGYGTDDLTLLTDGVMSSGINTEQWNVVLAQNVQEVSPETRAEYASDDNEDIEVFTIPLEHAFTELYSFREDGTNIDLRIFGLLELAKRHLAEKKT
jgi:ADP-ribose pyrophosphatase